MLDYNFIILYKTYYGIGFLSSTRGILKKPSAPTTYPCRINTTFACNHSMYLDAVGFVHPSQLPGYRRSSPAPLRGCNAKYPNNPLDLHMLM